MRMKLEHKPTQEINGGAATYNFLGNYITFNCSLVWYTWKIGFCMENFMNTELENMPERKTKNVQIFSMRQTKETNSHFD